MRSFTIRAYRLHLLFAAVPLLIVILLVPGRATFPWYVDALFAAGAFSLAWSHTLIVRADRFGLTFRTKLLENTQSISWREIERLTISPAGTLLIRGDEHSVDVPLPVRFDRAGLAAAVERFSGREMLTSS